MKKKLLLPSALFLFFLWMHPFDVLSQSGSVVISQTVPVSVDVCDSAQFIVKVQNITGNTLTGLKLNIAMPGGVNYIPGSISSIPAGVVQSNISNLQNPVFTIPFMFAFNSVFILIYAHVDCSIIAYQQQGNPILNTATVTYPNLTTDQNISTPYNINAPTLVITTFTNQSYTGAVGTTFTRSITIKNTGTGSLSSFTLTDAHAAQISVLSVTPGILGGTNINDTVSVTGTDFTSIGNGNNLFDNGESITIIETVKIVACVQPGVPSAIKAFWSCGNNTSCQVASTTANVTETPVGTPNLVVTPTESFETCLNPAVARKQSIRIVNIGAGSANHISMDIYQGASTIPNSSYQNRIDQTSFTFKVGINGSPIAITVDSSLNNSPYACLGSSPKYRVYLRIPVVINPIVDTVYLKWNSYACCQINSCDSSYFTAVAPWEFKGKYTDACDSTSTYDIFPTSGGSIYGRYLNTSLTPENMPTDISGATTTTFEHSVTNWQNQLDAAPGAYYQVQITIPPCFVLAANAHPIRFIYNPNGTFWYPTSPITTSGNVVTAIFATPDPFGINGLSQASLLFDLTSSCSCADSLKWNENIIVKINYNPDPSCSSPCMLKVYCNTSPINLHCGGPCPRGGLTPFTYKMARTSYGQPDNNNDGLPEVGTVNLSAIKTERAMFGDTLTGYFSGTIHASNVYPSFAYAYASATINNLGTYLSFIDAKVIIYDINTATHYTCGSVPPISAAPSGSNYLSIFDVSPNYLITNGCTLPVGFVYVAGDSVFIDHRYKVIANTGGPVVSSNTTTDFYSSAIPNPPPNGVPANKFTCDNFSGSYLSLYGYFFKSDTSETYINNSCNTPTIRNSNYLSIGPCCQNYGSNKFPFEYRPWANIDTIKVMLPAGYNYVSAIISGLGQVSTSIVPLNPSSDTLLFYVGALYPSPWLNYSFDGYANTINVTLSPSCNVANSILKPILYEDTHKKVPFIGGGSTIVNFIADHIAYNTSPQIILQSTLQTVNGINNIESWDVTLCNTSNNSNAFNSWISLVSPNSDITIVDVTDVTTSLIIPPVGNIYHLGTRPFNTCNKYHIRFKYTTCSLDSLIVNAGWNCTGYPDSLSHYHCVPKQYPLYIDPKPAALQMQIVGPSRDTVALCDTTTYEVVLNSVLLASVYNIALTATLPAGMTVEPGTSQVIYPKTPVVWAPLANPTITGQNNQWNLSTLIPVIDTFGLPGVNSTNLDQVRIRFKIRPDCNFICGSTVPFSATSKNVCGQNLPTQHATSSPLYIQGVQLLNSTSMTVTVDTIHPCGAPSLVTVKAVNIGPSATTGNEHFDFPMAFGSNYVPLSFLGIHNPPTTGTPTVIVLNGQNYLEWSFPVGIQLLDYTNFTFLLSVNPDSVKCSNITFPAKTTGSFTAVCITNNTPCIIRSITSAADINVPIGKPCLSVTALTGSSMPSGNGENISLNYTVFNSCGDKVAGPPVKVYFYFDNDNNGILSPGDTLIGTNTTTSAILANTSGTYTNIGFFSTKAPSCSILAILDTSFNACTCSNSIKVANLPLLNAGHDTAFCSGDSVVIGLVSTIGYTYLWSPVMGLSHPTGSSSTLTLQNNTSSPFTQAYVLTTDREGCISSDTVQITVNPKPIVTATPASQTVCSGSITAIALSSNVPGTTFSWTISQIGVTGATADSGTTISQTLTTIGNVAGTAIYTITPSSHGCPGAHITITITVSPADSSAAFNYTSGTYCQSGTNQTPVITGMPGGAFSSTPAGLSINPSTGTINLSTSSLGIYTVTYTTNGICPKTNSLSITITNITPSAAFSYSSSSFCPNGENDPFPVFALGASAGVFSATPSGLVFVNANTGQIDLTLSTPGIYTVINTISSSGSCLSATATTIVSIARDNASFVYTSATYCQSGANPTATITGLPGGNFSSSPTGLSINPSTGTINLATSALGSYTLCYATNGACPDTSCITMTITNTTPSAIFSYSSTSFCQMANNPTPIYGVGASAGIFSTTPVGLAFVNLNTGEINLALSTPGTYTVTNTIPVSGTCAAANATTTITINPSDDASFAYTSGTYCQSGTNPTPAITGLQGGSFSATPMGLSINPSTGTINLTTSSLGTYTLTYTTNGICSNTSSMTMTIGNTTPSANFSYTGSSFCPNGNNPFPIFASGASAGVFSATPTGLVFVNANTGQINLALSTPGTYTVSNTIPVSGTCLAAIDSAIITIALDNASFVYATTTYCQSGGNPAPSITGLPGGVFSSTPAGLTIDPITGAINLSTSVLGIYTISYTTNGTCSNTSSVTMTIGNTAPSASFTANPTTGEAPLTVNFTNNSTNATHYLWQFGTGDSSLATNPTYIYIPTGNFTVCLTAYNDGGCWDTACSTIDVYINSALVIPNVFTPNGDGINDLFSIKTKGLATFDAQIFNRWGQLLFEWHTVDGGWDGYSASGVLSSDGTYYYVIKATGLDAKDYLEKGSFSLIRDK